ncbi:hypothetical protein GCM10018953_64120 [Streptosporangium nondiastaticum]
MVAPGMTPTPPVTTRVGMPSVWESTAWKTRFVLISPSSGTFVFPSGKLGSPSGAFGFPLGDARLL